VLGICNRLGSEDEDHQAELRRWSRQRERERERERVGAKRYTEPRRLSFHPYPVENALTVKLCSHVISLGRFVLNSDALQKSKCGFDRAFLGCVIDTWSVCFVCSSMRTAK
jgi:hypothetical protein